MLNNLQGWYAIKPNKPNQTNLLRVAKCQIPPRKPSHLSRKNELPGSSKTTIPIPSDSLIPQEQKPTECTTPTSWKVLQKSPEEYDRDRVTKYAPYFRCNIILPIPEISEAMNLCIISLVVVSIKTRGFAGLKKDAFEDLMRAASIPGKYFCRRSFATRDVLLPPKDQAAKLAESCINRKFFRLQPDYMGTRRIRVTVCNVPANLPREVVASYMCAFSRVEMMQLRATAGTAHGDNTFRLCLDREGFQSHPGHLVLPGSANDGGSREQTVALREL